MATCGCQCLMLDGLLLHVPDNWHGATKESEALHLNDDHVNSNSQSLNDDLTSIRVVDMFVFCAILVFIAVFFNILERSNNLGLMLTLLTRVGVKAVSPFRSILLQWTTSY